MSKKEVKPCQDCKFKMECLEKVRLNLDVKCETEEHEKYEEENKVEVK
ncbi:MAG: hypothetical protein MJZ37_00950 [Bacilli bacterium]|nr:hypothetical protein [Bacilli bacterium]